MELIIGLHCTGQNAATNPDWLIICQEAFRSLEEQIADHKTSTKQDDENERVAPIDPKSKLATEGIGFLHI